ncbi:MAG: DUF2703 domain-containing protein [Thermodesulfovibrio sp.]|nr:DUF2703 domain-containing protein [Thermodesulfovibrio sp.]MCX7724900.1 DUF2703 domain-containing protein [Thermodesulfovibrio sp.]MDW7972322.1 DUF2703 domain-containing protein [Thermodesulfovibrio sp.]
MKNLTIKWQRLVKDNTTCPRCADTEKELEKAYNKLKEAFRILDIEVILEKNEINPVEFSENPLNSNLILINDKPLEAWLSAQTGKSRCCSVCGDEECRTIHLEGYVYETIPENLIIKACLIAASQLIPVNKTFKILPIKKLTKDQ